MSIYYLVCTNRGGSTEIFCLLYRFIFIVNKEYSFETNCLSNFSENGKLKNKEKFVDIFQKLKGKREK